MAQIRVRIRNQADGSLREVCLPDDVPVLELWDGLCDQAGLNFKPMRFQNQTFAGQKLPFCSLRHEDRNVTIPLEDTLRQAKVCPGDTMLLVPPRMGIRWSALETVIHLASGLPFQEVALLVAVQFDGLITTMPLDKSLPLTGLAGTIGRELVGNPDRRPHFEQRFQALLATVGLVAAPRTIMPEEHANWLILVNKTTGKVLDTNSRMPVSSVLRTGDCIEIKVRGQSDTIDLELDEDKDLLDAITILSDD